MSLGTQIAETAIDETEERLGLGKKLEKIV
jgi:hypothetical protein